MNTRIVAVELSALVRVLHHCSIRVPLDLTIQEMEIVMQHLYEQVDGKEYTERDSMFWEKEESWYSEKSQSEKVDWEVLRDRDGAVSLNRPKQEEVIKE